MASKPSCLCHIVHTLQLIEFVVLVSHLSAHNYVSHHPDMILFALNSQVMCSEAFWA